MSLYDQLGFQQLTSTAYQWYRLQTDCKFQYWRSSNCGFIHCFSKAFCMSNELAVRKVIWQRREFSDIHFQRCIHKIWLLLSKISLSSCIP